MDIILRILKYQNINTKILVSLFISVEYVKDTEKNIGDGHYFYGALSPFNFVSEGKIHAVITINV